MCTAITLQSDKGENFLGRTMDFAYGIETGILVIPKGYQWKGNQGSQESYIDKYSFICIGQEIKEPKNMLGIFDGVNEQGFAAASLYLPGYAEYDKDTGGENQIGSLDFMHYILGSCGTIDDLETALENISIVGQDDPVTGGAAPLHWIATDRSGRCIVVEKTEKGLRIFDNPLGVMTNSPEFDWHMTNIRNYTNVSNTQQSEVDWGNVALKPFGEGTGSTPLPGGFAPPERFVRTAFMKTHVEDPKDQTEAIMTCFHIMNSVTIPRGIAIVNDQYRDYTKVKYNDLVNESCDYTKYTAFVSTKTCEYYFKTYENDQIITVSLEDHKGSKELKSLGSIVRKVSFQSLSQAELC